MIAPVAAWLGTFYIILALYDCKIISPAQHFYYCIYVRYIIAGNSDTCKVEKILPCSVGRNRKSLFLKLSYYGLRRFKSAFNIMDRITLEFHAEFVIKYVKMSPYDFDSRVIKVL